MIKKIPLLLLPVILVIHGSPLFSCTGITAARGNCIRVGNNEDHRYLDTVVRIRPPSEGKYGRILVGFDRFGGSFGGMNERGLVMDSFGAPECDWQESAEKEDYRGNWFDHLLEVCESVEEVVTFCRRYNLRAFRKNHIFVVDKTGNSAVIEWGDEDIEAIRKQGDFQIITNFYLLHPERGSYPCWRYNRALEMLTSETIVRTFTTSPLPNDEGCYQVFEKSISCCCPRRLLAHFLTRAKTASLLMGLAI